LRLGLRQDDKKQKGIVMKRLLILTACYQFSQSGTPKGTMRAIDGESGEPCRFTEHQIDLATPAYVQSVAASTVNATSFMISAGGTVGPGTLQANYFCGTGYIATDFSVGATDNTPASNVLINTLTMYNEGEVLTGTPDTFGHLFAALSANVAVTIHATCVDGRVFGLPGPFATIAHAKTQANVTFKLEK
jgi:hypothetical protein